MGVVANSFSYVKMFGKLCEVQFFKHSLNVCGLSRGRIESHLAFQTWNSSSMIPALSKSLPQKATACSMFFTEETGAIFPYNKPIKPRRQITGEVINKGIVTVCLQYQLTQLDSGFDDVSVADSHMEFLIFLLFCNCVERHTVKYHQHLLLGSANLLYIAQSAQIPKQYPDSLFQIQK